MPHQPPVAPLGAPPRLPQHGIGEVMIHPLVKHEGIGVVVHLIQLPQRRRGLPRTQIADRPVQQVQLCKKQLMGIAHIAVPVAI